MDAVRQESLPVGRAKLLPRRPFKGASVVEEFVCLDSAPAFLEAVCENMLTGVFETKTEMRAAAIILAIRLYSVDHDGRRPRALYELVPNYLPVLPIDPCASQPQTFSYLPNRDPAIVYSVGLNGIDDGASKEDVDVVAGTLGRVCDWNGKDVVFVLRNLKPASRDARTLVGDANVSPKSN